MQVVAPRFGLYQPAMQLPQLVARVGAVANVPSAQNAQLVLPLIAL